MSRSHLIVILSFLILAGLGGQPAQSANPGEQSWPGHYTMRLGERTIKVEIAGTRDERVRGLSGRHDLAAGTGLLFVFPGDDTYGIWMKEMNFSIDILWISKDLRIIHIAADVSPRTYPDVFMPSEPARFVLEMPAGSARKMGLKVGTTVTLPAVLSQ